MPAEQPSSRRGATPENILHRIDWQIIRPLDGRLQGDYRTIFYGVGIDFSDLREYQPTDDIRHIDWNVTARMNSPYVRQYIEDREISVWFCLDLTGSMDFGPQSRTKENVVFDFAAALARLLTRGGNRVGALIYRGPNQEIQLLPPRTGRNQVLRLIQMLSQKTPSPAHQGITDLQFLLSRALTTLKRRSQLIVVSDLISEPGWERPLALLARRHECMVIQINDPLEKALPDVGYVVVEDIETGEQLWVNTSDPDFRERVGTLHQERESDINLTLRQAGVDRFSISTADDVVKALLRLAAQRQQRRRTTR